MDSSISTDQIKSTLGSIFKMADQDKTVADHNSTADSKLAGKESTTVEKKVATATAVDDKSVGQSAEHRITDKHAGGGQETRAAVAAEKDTTVEKDVAPAVEHEVRSAAHKEEETTVINKERHQDHYHTTIQPLKQTEILPEQHDYEEASKDRKINRDTGNAKAEAEAQLAQFKNTSEVGATTTVKSKEAVVGGEHIHHHFHETIQPVIEKETIQPSVTHKTITVNETIKEQSENLGITTAPVMSVDDFKGGVVGETKKVERVHDGAPDKKDAEILNKV
ncbi:hypothetical protein LTR36_004243 [Oleoguttula mirabilis]|uniref:Allergen n=1 Tax=Oleoguttula mirabilis TaxID=1507867 RepID=A0AAV9JHL3_9PEZI|nr:hypothetical protein LTR36_004243 [Oleoguttula mirabilis]